MVTSICSLGSTGPTGLAPGKGSRSLPGSFLYPWGDVSVIYSSFFFQLMHQRICAMLTKRLYTMYTTSISLSFIAYHEYGGGTHPRAERSRAFLARPPVRYPPARRAGHHRCSRRSRDGRTHHYVIDLDTAFFRVYNHICSMYIHGTYMICFY